jgi:hypothetical protein
LNLRHHPGRDETPIVRSYRQFFPIARASEVLAERWTPILRCAQPGAEEPTGARSARSAADRSALSL